MLALVKMGKWRHHITSSRSPRTLSHIRPRGREHMAAGNIWPQRDEQELLKTEFAQSSSRSSFGCSDPLGHTADTYRDTRAALGGSRWLSG